jgi:1,4-dihydroxy-2-naphthoyl-CoA synthase
MDWITAKEFDITYKKCNGVARIAFNRPDVRNALDPKQQQNCTKPSMMRKRILR